MPANGFFKVDVRVEKVAISKWLEKDFFIYRLLKNQQSNNPLKLLD